MDLRGYLTALRNGWWLVVIGAVLGAAVGTFFSYRATPIYAAHLSYYISTPTTTDSTALSTDQFAQDRANSYAQLLSSDRLGEMIVKSTGLEMTPRQVAREISATAQLNTVLVSATVKDSSAARALKIATAAATEFPKMVDKLDNSGSKHSNVALSVVSGPTGSPAPISPRKKLIIGIALLVGLFVGLAAAVLRHLLDASVRSVETLEEVAGVPALATVAYDTKAKTAPLLIDEAAHSLRGEAFRRLRTNLQFLGATQSLHTVVVTSSVEAEGKSTTATNLALVMGEAARRVLLIEADLRRPRVADYLGLERAVGLSNVLAGQVELDDVLQLWGPHDVAVLVSGSLPPNPSELLGSPAMADLLADLKNRFDLIVIDTPPLLPVTDAAVLAVQSDGVVVVFRHGKTKRNQLRAAIRALEAVNARVLGTVLNMKPIKRGEKRAYSGYGAYPDGTDHRAPPTTVVPFPDDDANESSEPSGGAATERTAGSDDKSVDDASGSRAPDAADPDEDEAGGPMRATSGGRPFRRNHPQPG